MPRPPADPQALLEGVRAGDRAFLGRAITLIESRRPQDRSAARRLLELALPDAGRALRVGVSGSPGVGKSTLLETLGRRLVDAGHRVAVLAVDPSSSRTGGSILGDKTRMPKLAADPRAFIRPSPSGGQLGGVAQRTREAMLVCEAAGFDIVLVETVGVGQSEVAVAHMVDDFVLLVLPGAGDDLQGIKRGILELADVVAVTKADGELRVRAERSRHDYAQSLRLMAPRHPGWTTRVLTCSATLGEGVDGVWQAVLDHRRHLSDTGQLEAQRAEQRVYWLWRSVEERLLAQVRDDARSRALAEAVRAGSISPDDAAAQLLGELVRPGPASDV